MHLLKTAIVALATSLPLAASAVPGVTTTNVNLRSGPGTSYDSLGVLPGGTPVDVGDCSDAGTWCSVQTPSQSGFVSGNYLQISDVPVDAPPGVDLVDATGGVTGGGDGLLTEGELDTLVAPIALYPDNLVAQVLVAATYPLDVVKAERWIAANADMPAGEREAAANAQGWDESIAILAAGFPSVIALMANDLDATEALGDAMLAQNEDVLDAIQRQRARAQSVGNLSSNEAQVVETVDNTIVIESAQPDRVYVPAYDPVTTYTTPVAQQPVYVENIDSGWDTGAVLATGAIAFGTGLAINSIFNDNYRDYWYGPPRVHWDNHYFYPRPGYRPPPRPGWGGHPGRPGRPGRPDFDRPGRPDRPDIGRPDRPDIGRPDRPDIGRPGRPGDRPGRPGDRPGRPGDTVGRPGGGGSGAWKPDQGRRQEARRNIENRKGGDGARRPGATRPAGTAARPGNATRPGGRPNAGSVEQRLKAGSGGNRPAAAKRPGGASAGKAAPARKAAARPSGLSKPKGQSMTGARKAASRGKSSAQRRVASPQRAAPHKATRPQAARAPTRKASPSRSAIRKAPAHRASASRARGHASRGGGGGRRRR